MKNVSLYPYQRLALDKVKARLQISNKALMVMATGLGKTIVSAFFAQQELMNGKRGLFLCHENDILQQAEKEYSAVIGKSYSLKTFYGINKDWNADKADVLFASFQSFADWCKVFDPTHFDFIIVDESHHGQAPTFKEVINYFAPKKLLGMTATPDRMDEKDIRDIFGEEVVNYCLEEAIANGWLTNIEYHVLNDDLRNLDRLVKLVDERKVTLNQLNKSIFIKMRDEVIASTLKEFAGPKKAIIFCQSIEHAENFSQHLEKSAVVHSQNSVKQNSQALQSFREGEIQYVLTVNMFNEGIDVPDTEVVVFLRCTDSRTIFLQQLGRGLRKSDGKDKVMVLDFVSNCERLLLLNNLVTNIERFAGDKVRLFKDKLHISGDSFNFIFNDRQVDIIKLLNRFNVEFYPTWQKASKAAIKLGIKMVVEYSKMYKADSKLPSCPKKVYKDFPTWKVFLGGEDKEFYPTWQEASKAAIKLGIKTQVDYKQMYKQDPRLTSIPIQLYKDFPGLTVFLGGEEKEFYLTWQEASNAAIGLGVKTQIEYKKMYKDDPKLPSNPNKLYKDFPGWIVFLGGEDKEFYLTWQEASKTAIELGIKTQSEYYKMYKADPKLPSTPSQSFKDFPSWPMFLGGEEKERYLTWQEASKAAIELGIKTQVEYKKMYKADPKLLSNPNRLYKDFPRWKVFLGGEDKEFYLTWQEASKVVISLGIRSKNDYGIRHKIDPKLPSTPSQSFKGFPGWLLFLGGEEKERYSTWQEASKVVISLGISTVAEYKKMYKADPKLPSVLGRHYKDFPGWKKFLGKK